MGQLRSLDAAVPLTRENVISFLPMAHAGGRLTSHYMALVYGATITCCPDIKELPAYLAAVHPDSLFSVPRLWEKLEAGIMAMIEGTRGRGAEDGPEGRARGRVCVASRPRRPATR